MKRVEMIGKTFGRLTVVALSPNTSGKKKRLKYICNCSCGKTGVEVIGERLRAGTTKSCGCLAVESKKTSKKKYNVFDLKNSIFKTTNTGVDVKFDTEDYEFIKNYGWMEAKNGYIVTRIDSRLVYLHRFVMKCNNPSQIVDHINHDLKDCQKSNLRICSQSHNMMNVVTKSDNTSGKKGVWYSKTNKKWVAEIWYLKLKIYIGSYDLFETASDARDIAEKILYKNYAYSKDSQQKNIGFSQYDIKLFVQVATKIQATILKRIKGR